MEKHIPPAGHSVDAFHRGRFHLVQPLEGHRAGMDALVLAGCVPEGFAGRLADLGAGSGAAGLAALSRCPSASAVLVEREPRMLVAARLTLAFPANRSVASRVELLEADVELSGRARSAAGLADNSFDFVLMNPPFNARDDRATADELRKAAHVMSDETIANWLRTACAITVPGGGVAMIARPQSLPDILATLEGRAGDARIVPVHPRPEAAAIRILVLAKRGSRARLSLMPPLVLHEAAGNGLSARADAVVNGERGAFSG